MRSLFTLSSILTITFMLSACCFGDDCGKDGAEDGGADRIEKDAGEDKGENQKPTPVDPGNNFENWRAENRGELAFAESFVLALAAGDPAKVSPMMSEYAQREAAALFESVDAYVERSSAALQSVQEFSFDPAFPIKRPLDEQDLRYLVAFYRVAGQTEPSELVLVVQELPHPQQGKVNSGFLIHNVLTKGALHAKSCAPAFGVVISGSLKAFQVYYYASMRGLHLDGKYQGVVCTPRERLTYLRNCTTEAFRQRALEDEASVNEKNGSRSLIQFLNFGKHIVESYYQTPEPIGGDPLQWIDVLFRAADDAKEDFASLKQRFTIVRRNGQDKLDQQKPVPEPDPRDSQPTPVVPGEDG